jgi:hypothetical protein
MNFADYRTALRSVVLACSGLSHAGAVEFGDTAAASNARNMPRIDLALRGLKGYGDDEERLNDDGDSYTCGPRRLTLSVRIESTVGVSGEAFEVASRIQTRLGRPAVLAELKAAGIAVSGGSDVTPVAFKKDGRQLNVALFDLFLNVAENDLDDTAGAGDRIATVEVESEYLTHPDDAQGPQIDLTVEDTQ